MPKRSLFTYFNSMRENWSASYFSTACRECIDTIGHNLNKLMFDFCWNR